VFSKKQIIGNNGSLSALEASNKHLLLDC